MSSVVRTTTGMTIMASATAPASPEKWPIGAHQDLVDEQADDDRRRAEQDVVDEAHDRRQPAVAAVFGHVGAGQDADRRADEHARARHDQAADDGVAAGRRRLPGGGVISVKTAGDRPPRPFEQASTRISTSTARPSPAAAQRQAHDRPCFGALAAGGVSAAVDGHGHFPALRSRRISMVRASASTIKVMKNRMSPSAISDDV